MVGRQLQGPLFLFCVGTSLSMPELSVPCARCSRKSEWNYLNKVGQEPVKGVYFTLCSTSDLGVWYGMPQKIIGDDHSPMLYDVCLQQWGTYTCSAYHIQVTHAVLD